MKPTRHRLVLVAAVLVLAVAAWLVYREGSHLYPLPPHVQVRMPGYWRTMFIFSSDVRQAAQGLYSPTSAGRRQACRDLENLCPRSEATIPWLIAALADGVPMPEGTTASQTTPNAKTEPLVIRLWDWLLGPHPEEDPMEFLLQPAEAASDALAEIGGPAVPSLCVALTDPLPGARFEAARALSNAGDSRAFEPLVGILGDSNELVRVMAAIALGELGDRRAVEHLAKIFGDPQAGTPPSETYKGTGLRGAAAEALDRLGGRGREILLESMRGPNPALRLLAVRAFSETHAHGDPQIIAALVAALDDPSPEVASAAAWEMMYLKTPLAVEGLLRALRHRVYDVRSHALWALKEYRDPRIVEPLIATLDDDFSVSREQAAEALGRVGDRRAVEPLIRRLRDKDDQVQRQVMRALGTLGDPRAVEPLAALIGKEGNAAAGEAAAALAQIKDPRAVPAMVRAHSRELAAFGKAAVEPLLASPADGRWECAVIEMLGDIGDRRAFDRLLAALRSPDLAVAYAAAPAIGKLHDPRAYEPLLDTMKRTEILATAIEGLGHLKDRRAIGPIMAAWEAHCAARPKPASDEHGVDDYPLREAVAMALLELGDPRGVPMFFDFYHNMMCWRECTDPVPFLIEMGRPAAEPLTAALADKRGIVSWVAAKALISLQGPAATDTLLRAMPEISQENRAQLVCYITNAKPKGMTAFLAEMLRRDKDSQVRSMAACALSETGGPEAAEPLRQALRNDPNRWVRQDAARALESLTEERPEPALLRRWLRRMTAEEFMRR
jgi:HEAT repeat protein